MNKEAVQAELIAIQKNIIKELQQQIDTVHTMVDIDEEMTHDPEDYSHQYESQEIEHMVKVQLNRAKNGLNVIESIDFSPKNTVTAGAIVETEQFKFLIGFATVPFDVGEDHFVGVSKNSPIYPIMANKKTGETFSYSGRSYTIKNIY